MKDKNGLKIFILIFCIGVSILGIYMQFFGMDRITKKDGAEGTQETDRENMDPGDKEKTNGTEKTESTERNVFDMADLPDTENESADETYTGKQEITVYFSNTEKLDQGHLPLSVQAELTEDAQKYLKMYGYGDVTELYIDEESYSEDEEAVRFQCFMDGYQDKLQIEYTFGDSTLRFSIITGQGSTVE